MFNYADVFFGFPPDFVCPEINYVLLTGPALSPITLDQLKLQARITSGSVEDSILTSYILAAVRQCENYIRRDLINKTWIAFMNFFPQYGDQGILLKRSKLQSITSIQYMVDSVYQTFTSTDYYKTNNDTFASIYLKPDKSWPTGLENVRQAVRIEFISGYGADASFVPDNIKLGLLQHATFLYQSRGDSADGGFSNDIPATVKAIYDAEKIWQV